ncbi:MAG: dynamin family protein [Mycobacteriales bacterium]
MTVPSPIRPPLPAPGEVAEQAIEVLRRPRPEAARRVEELHDTRPGTPSVVIVGETKRGKSSLVNALLNMPGLSPVDTHVATRSYLSFRHGDVDRAFATVPGAPEPVPLELADLRDWATERGNLPDGQPPARLIDVECTSPLLTNMTVIDTPGVGGLDSAHGEIAMHAVRAATALLFVVDASSPFTSHELAFLRQASEAIDLVIFAITKIDAYRGWRQVVEDDRALLAKHAPRFAKSQLHPVSSRMFEQAASAPKAQLAIMLRTESKITALQIALQSQVVAKSGSLHRANVLRSARTALAAYYRDLGVALTAVDPNPQKVQALRSDRERLVAQKRSDGRQWQLKLRSEMARARLETMHDVQGQIRDALHYWRMQIDGSNKERLQGIPAEMDAALHAISLGVFDRIVGRLRAVTETTLRDTFTADELDEVYAEITRSPAFHGQVTRPDARPATSEDKILLFGGISGGMGMSRLIAYLPAAVGAGAASVVLAPLSIGLGLGLTAWMIHSRRHIAEKNHLKVWVSEVLGEARSMLDAEVGNQFIDAEQTLTLALDSAVQRRIGQLDEEIKDIDAALKLNAAEKDKRRTELTTRQNVVKQTVGKIDAVLPALRAAGRPTSKPSLFSGPVLTNGGEQ